MNIQETQGKVTMKPDHPRSPGLHLTDVLRPIAVRMGFFKEQDGDGEDPTLRMSAGLAWEDWLSKQNHDWVYHFGEAELDGIAGTPDCFDLVHDRLVEIKFTWKSSTRPIEKEWYWWAQIKCYCKMMSEFLGQPVLNAELHVYWAMGDYRGSGPQYKVYEAEFTQQEIDALWQMVVREAKSLGLKD
jgi:hypothetical protein